MDIKTIDATLLEWLYARELARQLGFTPDELFFVIRPKGKSFIEKGVIYTHDKPCLILLIKAQGKEFTWTIGETDIPDEK